jgi:arylsulfatase A-like enzyme
MFNRGHWKKLQDSPAGPEVVGGENAKAARESDEKSFTTDFLADKAVQFIKAHHQERFCYMVAFPDPHTPRTVRSPYDALFSSLKFSPPRTAGKPATGMPFWGTTLDGTFGRAADYFGMVKCIDDSVGKILAELKANGLWERTIIVFTADHGDMCGEHGRNAKSIPQEASAKIPLLICAPGRLKPGTVVSAAIANTDFKPTILKLMGVPADPQDEGRDVSALLLSGPMPKDWKDIVFPRIGNDKSGWMGAFTGRYKLVVSPVGDPCLLDLQTDPDEMTNVFLKPGCRQTVRELAQALREHARKFKDPLADNPAIQADLAWAADGKDTPYVPVKRAAPAPSAPAETE